MSLNTFVMIPDVSLPYSHKSLGSMHDHLSDGKRIPTSNFAIKVLKKKPFCSDNSGI